VGQQQKHQAENYLKSWQAQPWKIQFVPIEKGHFTVVQYELKSVEAAKNKLAQFSAGTVFLWSGDSNSDGEEQAFHDLSASAVEHGFTFFTRRRMF
jgi:hypothetical protein